MVNATVVPSSAVVPDAGTATPVRPTPRVEPVLVPGVAWLGREWMGSGWDFIALANEVGEGGVVRYRFEASPLHGPGARRGTLEVVATQRRLKGVLRMPGRASARVYDASTALVNGRVIAVGRAWDEDEPRVRAIFWATLEKGLPVTAASVPLNQASVAELEGLGLAPRSARTIAEGRILWRPYLSMDEALAAPGLTPSEKEVLRARTLLR